MIDGLAVVLIIGIIALAAVGSQVLGEWHERKMARLQQKTARQENEHQLTMAIHESPDPNPDPGSLAETTDHHDADD